MSGGGFPQQQSPYTSSNVDSSTPQPIQYGTPYVGNYGNPYLENYGIQGLYNNISNSQMNPTFMYGVPSAYSNYGIENNIQQEQIPSNQYSAPIPSNLVVPSSSPNQASVSTDSVNNSVSSQQTPPALPNTITPLPISIPITAYAGYQQPTYTAPSQTIPIVTHPANGGGVSVVNSARPALR